VCALALAALAGRTRAQNPAPPAAAPVAEPAPPPVETPAPVGEEPVEKGVDEPTLAPPQPAEESETATGLPVRHGLLYSVAAAGLHDDGFSLKGETVRGNAYLVRGSLLYDGRPSGRSSFVLAYEPEAEFFGSGQSHLDAVNHAAGVYYDVEISRRSHFLVGGSYLKADDPTRYLGGALLFLPEGGYQQSRAYLDLDHHWERTAVSLHVEGSSTDVQSWPDFQATDLRDRESGATLTLEHNFGVRSALSLSGSYLQPDLTGVLDGPARQTLYDQPLQTVIATFTQHFGAHWSFAASGGGLRQRPSDADRASQHPIYSLEVVGHGAKVALEMRWERAPLSIGFNPATTPGLETRALIPAAVLPGHLVQAGGLDVVFLLPADWHVRQGVWLAHADTRDGGVLESWGASSRLVKTFSERVSLFGEAELYHQGAFDRKRFLVGLEFGLLGPREAVTLDRDVDPRRRALPETRGN
jgi:hypothetical protein